MAGPISPLREPSPLACVLLSAEFYFCIFLKNRFWIQIRPFHPHLQTRLIQVGYPSAQFKLGGCPSIQLKLVKCLSAQFYCHDAKVPNFTGRMPKCPILLVGCLSAQFYWCGRMPKYPILLVGCPNAKFYW